MAWISYKENNFLLLYPKPGWLKISITWSRNDRQKSKIKSFYLVGLNLRWNKKNLFLLLYTFFIMVSPVLPVLSIIIILLLDYGIITLSETWKNLKISIIWSRDNWQEYKRNPLYLAGLSGEESRFRFFHLFCQLSEYFKNKISCQIIYEFLRFVSKQLE